MAHFHDLEPGFGPLQSVVHYVVIAIALKSREAKDQK